MISTFIYFVISCTILIISGIYLVKSLTKIAKFFGISEFSASFIIMAFATSIPEFFIGISSALANAPSLSLGNIIGANIIDLTLVIGIVILLSKEIKFKSKNIGNEIYYMLFTISSLIILFLIGMELSRIDGLILIVLFLIPTYEIFKKRKRYNKKIKTERVSSKKYSKKFYWLLIFIFALICLFFSSNFVVKYALEIAIDLKIPQIIVGLFLLSIATTLPELIFGIFASKLEHKEMAVGNQIGTVITNSAFILGIVALINPIKSELLPFLISSIFMFVAAFIFITFIKSGNKLEKYEGISLILIYVLFVTFEFFLR